jgi:hypothetical protein
MDETTCSAKSQLQVHAPSRFNERAHLSDDAVQVGESRRLNAELATADVVNGLVVDEEGAVHVLERGVGGEDGVVGLDDRRGEVGSRVDREGELGLLAVILGETLEEESAEAGSRSSSERVEDEESLQAVAVVGQLADPVASRVDELLADGVVSCRESSWSARGAELGGVCAELRKSPRA